MFTFNFYFHWLPFKPKFNVYWTIFFNVRWILFNAIQVHTSSSSIPCLQRSSSGSYDLLDWSTWRGTCKGVGQEPKIQNIFCQRFLSSSSDHKGLKHLVVSRVDLAKHLVIPLWVTHWIIFLLRTFSIFKQINLKLNHQYFEIDLDSVFWYRKLNNFQHAYHFHWFCVSTHLGETRMGQIGQE